MNWALAIDRNREALRRIIAALFVMAGLGEGDTIETLPRHLRNHLLRILRPAESAVRRLIVMAAKDVEVTGPRQQRREAEALKGGTEDPKAKRQKSQERGRSSPSLPLLDPLKRFSFSPDRRRSASVPRIWFPGAPDPIFVSICLPMPDDPVDARRLGLRLAAVRHALDDLDGQAKRYIRWKARRSRQDRASSEMQRGFTSVSVAKLKDVKRIRKRLTPFRPGWPPGYRKRPVHAVDDVLRDCHSFALAALKPPDTS